MIPWSGSELGFGMRDAQCQTMLLGLGVLFQKLSLTQYYKTYCTMRDAQCQTMLLGLGVLFQKLSLTQYYKTYSNRIINQL